MSDFVFGPAAFGDVLEGFDPPLRRRHVFVGNEKNSAVGSGENGLPRFLLAHQLLGPLPDGEPAVAGERNRLFGQIHQGAHRHARGDPRPRHAEHFEKAIIHDHHLEVLIQHAQTLRHVVQGRGELLALFLHALVDDQSDGAERQHKGRRGGDKQSEHPRFDGGRRHHEPWIRHDADGSHPGEVKDDDGGTQSRRGNESHRHVGRPRGGVYRGDAENDAKRNRIRDEVDSPGQPARHFKRRHAEVMHAGDGDTDGGATGRHSPPRR